MWTNRRLSVAVCMIALAVFVATTVVSPVGAPGHGRAGRTGLFAPANESGVAERSLLRLRNALRRPGRVLRERAMLAVRRRGLLLQPPDRACGSNWDNSRFRR